MPFWKTKIENPTGLSSRILDSITMKQTNSRNFVVRVNYADGSFEDVDSDRPIRFDLGETLTVTFNKPVEIPEEAAE